MRKLRTLIAIGAVAGMAMISGAAIGRARAADGRDDLAAVRAATAEYHRLDAAEQAGYVDFGLCFDHMGEHFGQPASIGDGILHASEPEALVYAHIEGRLQLVAVEYVSTAPGDVLGMPLHFSPAVGLWVLHAWVWKHNPDGVHADFNPLIGTCP